MAHLSLKLIWKKILFLASKVNNSEKTKVDQKFLHDFFSHAISPFA